LTISYFTCNLEDSSQAYADLTTLSADVAPMPFRSMEPALKIYKER